MNRSWLLTVLGVVLTVPSVVLANRCAGQPDGLFIADFTDCQAFFTCFRGEPFPGRCTFDYLFNEAAQICDFKWNVKCLICPQDSDVPTLEPIEGECSYYALCFQGIGSLRQCADGLLFDTVAGQCDLPEIANCDAGVCPTNVDPNVPVSVPHPDDCSKYYVCLRNEGTEMQCAPTLLFNPETNLCDLEENVECIQGPTAPTTCPPTGLILIGNPANCNTYFVCLDGQQSADPIACAEGLIFDVRDSICRIANEESLCADGTPAIPVPPPPPPPPANL